MASPPSRFERTRCFRRGWVFERVGWIAMAAVLLATAAGLFGNGWLSEREVSAGDSFMVRYPRFARAHSPFDLGVDWVLPQQEAALSISRSYLDGFEIAEIRPAPSAVTAGPDRTYYTFRTSEPHAHVGVTFTLRPKHGGRFSGTVGSRDAEVEVRQLVYP
jgi:hypothetical protein